MPFTPRNLAFSLSGLAMSACLFLVGADPGVAETGTPIQAAPALITAAVIADPRIAADAALLADDNVTVGSGKPLLLAEPSENLDPDLVCMAKIVRHEAANQSRQGQIAVAQIVLNRVRSGKFRDTICAVALQPGQFFDVNSYNPSRDTPQWKLAVEVSREVLSGTPADPTNSALFYHAAYQAPNRFFRTRQRVTTIGDHIFYR